MSNKKRSLERASWPFLALKNSWKHRIIVLTGRVNKEKFMLSALNADKLGKLERIQQEIVKLKHFDICTSFWKGWMLKNSEIFGSKLVKMQQGNCKTPTSHFQTFQENFEKVSVLCLVECWKLKTQLVKKNRQNAESKP